MHRGYIKLWRKVCFSGLQQDHKTFTLWIYILCHVTHKECDVILNGQRIHLMPGEMITGRKRLAKDLRASERNIRTCLQRLQNIGNMTIRTTNKYSIISVTNWERYQLDDRKNDQQNDQWVTSNRPTSDHIQECKECKNVKETKDIMSSAKANGHIPYSEIISYLNTKAAKNFNPATKVTRQHIKARWNEGFRLDDFKRVIDVKASQWLADAERNQYLRPQTLFGTKFEGYLNETGKTAKEMKDDKWARFCEKHAND